MLALLVAVTALFAAVFVGVRTRSEQIITDKTPVVSEGSVSVQPLSTHTQFLLRALSNAEQPGVLRTPLEPPANTVSDSALAHSSGMGTSARHRPDGQECDGQECPSYSPGAIQPQSASLADITKSELTLLMVLGGAMGGLCVLAAQRLFGVHWNATHRTLHGQTQADGAETHVFGAKTLAGRTVGS
jgi:hypothetical protein